MLKKVLNLLRVLNKVFNFVVKQYIYMDRTIKVLVVILLVLLILYFAWWPLLAFVSGVCYLFFNLIG